MSPESGSLRSGPLHAGPPDDLPWFFVPTELRSGESLELPPEEAQHGAKSLRLAVGSALVVANGQGTVARARVVMTTRRSMRVDLVEVVQHAADPCRRWLAAAVVRGPRFDFVIEKATELGVTGVIPLLTRHTEVRPGAGLEKSERWGRLAVAALKQSRRAWLPEILDPLSLDALPHRFPEARLFVACPETHGAAAQSNDLNQDSSASSREASDGEELLLTGPEGGWHSDELAAFSRAGARFVHLGSARLRAETAAVALLAWALTRGGIFRSRLTP